jgi:hypothetical protein
LDYEIYHKGMLITDRKYDPALNEKASNYLKLSEQGKAILLQKRISDNAYEYRVYHRSFQ